MNISVYIPSYNQSAYLKEAIESVLSQTRPATEIMIIDDCSSDDSRELIMSYYNSYPDLIVPVLLDSNHGITQVRIKALQTVKGEYVTYLDGDDCYLPRKLEMEAALIEKYGADIAFSNFCTFNDVVDEPRSVWADDVSQLPQFGNMWYQIFMREFPKNTLFRCELISRNKIGQVGVHDLNMKIYEDFEFKIRLAKDSKIVWTLQPSLMYRNNPSGLSRSGMKLHVDSFKYIFNKHAPEFIRSFPDKTNEINERYELFYKRFGQTGSVKGNEDISLLQRIARKFK